VLSHPIKSKQGDKTARDVFIYLYKFRTGGETGENGAASLELDQKAVKGSYGRRCAMHYALLLGIDASESSPDSKITLKRAEGLTSVALDDVYHEVMSMPKRRRTVEYLTSTREEQQAMAAEKAKKKTPKHKYKPDGREAQVRLGIMGGVEAGSRFGAAQAMEHLRSAQADGTHVAAGSFNALIHLLSEKGNVDEITFTLCLMKDRNMKESESQPSLLTLTLTLTLIEGE